jgi:integrase/recombinase XerD
MKTRGFRVCVSARSHTRQITIRLHLRHPRRETYTRSEPVTITFRVPTHLLCELRPRVSIETSPAVHANRRGVTVADAVEGYLADAKSRELASPTLEKLERIFRKQLLSWTSARHLPYLDQLTTAELTNFRNTWKDGALSRKKKHERLIGFFAFCIRNGWLEANPALPMSRVKVEQVPTGYFSREEFDTIEQAIRRFGMGSLNPKRNTWSQRLHAMLLLLRWSGLRIQDATTLGRSRLSGDKLLLYQAKTGTPVYVPLPPNVAEALRGVPSGKCPNPRYFFWSGNGDARSGTKVWQRAFRRLFELADIRSPDGRQKRCFPHMFRDTFAVELLLAGVPLDQVAVLLGHSSTKITERHYSPWVKARQMQLEASVQRAWSAQRT